MPRVSLLSFAEWVDTHAWSTALHESLYMYPWVESTHVLTLCLFVGTLIAVDLRLLGFVFKDVPVSHVTNRMLPWTVAGFVIMTITGLLLFYAIPVRTYQSLWFRIKVILLIIAGINAWFFHKKVQRDQALWDSNPIPPKGARVSAAVSLVMWAGVIVTGRFIAYNWFDCDRPQTDLVIWLAGCVVDEV
jgi:uncharacterized membrane protein